jgi:hypothetical protein
LISSPCDCSIFRRGQGAAVDGAGARFGCVPLSDLVELVGAVCVMFTRNYHFVKGVPTRLIILESSTGYSSKDADNTNSSKSRISICLHVQVDSRNYTYTVQMLELRVRPVSTRMPSAPGDSVECVGRSSIAELTGT